MSTYNIYLYNFNNYSNRVEKSFPEIAYYSDYLVCNPMTNINFNPNDGVNASLIVNTFDKTYYDGEPNYCIIEDMQTNDFTRWFIIETVYERNGQMRITLKRDVIADNMNYILDAPCFIEKGTVPNTNNLVFNNENMTYNQIKTGETLITDNSLVPWIIGYIAQKTGEGTVPSWEGKVGIGSNYDYYIPDKTHENWKYGIYTKDSSKFKGDPENHITYNLNFYVPGTKYYNYNLGFTQLKDKTFKSYATDSTHLVGYRLQTDRDVYTIYDGDYPNWFNDLQLKSEASLAIGFHTGDDLNDFLAYDGKKVKFSDGVYILRVRTTTEGSQYQVTANSGALFTTMKNTTETKLQELFGQVPTSTSPMFNINYKVISYYFEYTKIENDLTYNYKISADRNHLKDNPYDMFAIPYDSVQLKNGTDIYTTSAQAPQMVASDIPLTGSTYVYDIQLLPYCPIQNVIVSNNTVDVSTLTEGKDYNFITSTVGENTTNTGIILYANSNSFSFIKPLTNPIVIKEPKIESECDMYRLCGPNYNGVFEFNAAKNGGISYFEIACTYIPFNPFIQVNPNFGGLYGRDFNDNRGLICAGEFSLPIVNDNWITYQLQNKNYEKSFQRNIDRLELEAKVGTIQDIATAISGTASAGLMGNMIGGPAIGATSALTSALAGGADIAINNQLRRDNINLQKDQFGYQLGNIKALPNTLSRASSFNTINKKFPFLEYYTCSDEEKEALRNKIKYEGMTVMVVGKIRDYIVGGKLSFIKGRIIRIDDETFYGDSHLLNEIYDRINQGIYIL